MFKVNISPPRGDDWLAGFEAQAIGSCRAESGASVDACPMAKLNLLISRPAAPGKSAWASTTCSTALRKSGSGRSMAERESRQPCGRRTILPPQVHRPLPMNRPIRLAGACLLVALAAAPAHALDADERSFKAAFVYNLLKFVELPQARTRRQVSR